MLLLIVLFLKDKQSEGKKKRMKTENAYEQSHAMQNAKGWWDFRASVLALRK